MKHFDYLLVTEHAGLKKDLRGMLNCCSRYGQIEEDVYYRKEAIRFYSAWGATAKAALLQKQLGLSVAAR